MIDPPDLIAPRGWLWDSQIGRKCDETTISQLRRTSQVEQNARSRVLVGAAKSDSLEPGDSYGAYAFSANGTATASLRCSNGDRLTQQAGERASW